MALGTFTQLASVRNASVSTLSTGSFTPTNGALLLIIAAACVDSGNGNDLQLNLANSLSLTQNSIGFAHRGSAGSNPANYDHGTAAWWVTSTGTSMTFTVSTSSTGYGRVGLRVYEITGQNVASPIGGTYAGATTPAQPAINSSCTVTLSASPATDSLVIGVLCPGCGSSTPGTPVEGSGWTEIWDAPYDDWYGWQGESRTGSSSSTVSWASYYQTGQDDSYGDVSSVAFEIKAASGSGNSISVPVASVTLDAKVPTVTATANNFIAVPKATIDLAAKVPTITATANQSIAVPLATMTLAAQTPTVTATQGQFISVPAASITLDGKVPTVSATQNNFIAVPLATISLDAKIPTVSVSGSQSIAVPVASVTLDGFAPTVTATANNAIAVPLGTVSLNAFAPTVTATDNKSVAVPLATVSLDAKVPTVTATANNFISVPVGSVTLDGFAPTVAISNNQLIQVPKASLTLDAIAPVVNTGGPQVIDVPLAAISITVFAPQVVVSGGETGSGNAGGGGGSWISERQNREHGKKIRKQVEDILDDLPQIYAELTATPEVKKAAAIVKPFAETKKAVPAEQSIDWVALQKDARRVSRLVALWQQQRAIEEEEEAWFMLGD